MMSKDISGPYLVWCDKQQKAWQVSCYMEACYDAYDHQLDKCDSIHHVFRIANGEQIDMFKARGVLSSDWRKPPGQRMAEIQ
jgi:hypothetical protein